MEQQQNENSRASAQSRAEGANLTDVLAAVKRASGIECANCQTCMHKGQDNDGGEPEYSIAWDICEKFPHYANLPTFPFGKEMPCWEPEFWHSKFAGEIKTGEHEEVMGKLDEFMAAIKAANA